LIRGRLIALIGRLGEEGRKGSGGARRDSRGGTGPAGQQGGEEERKGERERLTGGAQVLASAGKRKGGGA
jgi:hypothetical protein